MAIVCPIGSIERAIAGDPSTTHAAPHDTKKSDPSSAKSPPSENEARSTATSEEILRALQQQRPTKEIIPPESLRQRENPQSERRKLFTETYPFVDHFGSIVPSGGNWLFQDRDDPTIKYQLLPNAALEVAVHTNDAGRDPITYKVSGEFTVFDDENYLLLRSVMRASRTEPFDAANEEKAKPNSGASKPSAPASSEPPSHHNDTAEDVLNRMQGLEPSEGIVSPLPTASNAPRGSAGGRGLLLDGSYVASRPGRLVKQDEWWVLNPEPAQKDTMDAPLRVLPGQGLEMMLHEAKKSSMNQVFVVSGEVTLFEGQNYLLPRSVLRRVNFENLHP